MAPHFRNGYDKHLDLTEDEYWEANVERYEAASAMDAEPPFTVVASFVYIVEGDALDDDTYLPGIPDYDRFNRPSWEN